MHIKCERKELQTALQSVIGATTNKSVLDVTNNFLLVAKLPNILEIISSNHELTLKTQILCRVEVEGKVTAPAKQLFDIIKECESSEVDYDIEIKVNVDSRVTIKNLKTKFNLMGLDSSGFPGIVEPSDIDSISINKKSLHDLVQKTLNSVSMDILKPILTGININISNNEITLVSTDGRRLSIAKDSVENKDLIINCIVPLNAMKELVKFLNNDVKGNVLILIKDNQITFLIDDKFLSSKLIDGNYINYKALIPNESKYVIEINRDRLYKSVKKVSLMRDKKNATQMKFMLENNKLTMTVHSGLIGDASDEIDILWGNESFYTAYNPEFIIEFLDNILSETISLSLNAPNSIALIKEKGNENLIYMFMPMRVN